MNEEEIKKYDFVWKKGTDGHRQCRGLFPCKYCGEYTSCECGTCHNCFESSKDLEMEK